MGGIEGLWVVDEGLWVVDEGLWMVYPTVCIRGQSEWLAAERGGGAKGLGRTIAMLVLYHFLPQKSTAVPTMTAVTAPLTSDVDGVPMCPTLEQGCAAKEASTAT